MIIVIPMAGRGSRYSTQGYTTPKPLIEINQKPMFWHAFQSIKNISYTKLIFVALKEHQEMFDLRASIRKHVSHQFSLVLLEAVTEGQLCTVLAAEEFFKPDVDLLIASCDTYVFNDIDSQIKSSHAEGIISVAKLPGDNWSFAKTDQNGRVVEVAEKTRISDYASTGLYYFRDSARFLHLAKKHVAAGEKIRGEYYVMPLYRDYIAANYLIEIAMADSVWDLGTPEGKLAYENKFNK